VPFKVPGFRERLASALGFRQAPPTSEPAPTGRGVTRMLNPILYSNPRLQTTSTIAPNPSLVVQRKSFKIFDAILLDEQVGAALAFKKLAVLSTGWKVESPPGKPEDWEVTKFVRDNLETMHGSFKDALRQMLTCFDYGFSVTEKIYEKIDGKLYLRRLQTVAPHDVRFKTDEFGVLLGLSQQGNRDPIAQGNVDARTIPLDKLMIFSWEAQFGNWYGRSDLERAHRAWLMKDQSYVWLGMMLERYGVPPILIDYDGTTVKDDVQTKLVAAFRAFQSGLAALIPRGEKSDSLKVTTIEMAGQVSSVFVPSINLNDQHIAKAILMPGLLGLTADATEGSLARSNTHFDVFLMVCDFARELLSEIVIQEQLVRQLVDFNFPNIEEYPVFTLLPVGNELRKELLDTWIALAAGKVVNTSPADEAHIRKEMKFPDIETAEDSIPDDEDNPNAPPPPPPNPLDPNAPKLDDDGNPIEPPANDPPPPPSKKKFSFEPTRELTTHEAKVDFAQIEQDLDGITADYIDRLRSALLKVEAALLSDVRRNYQPNLEYAQSVTVLPQTDDLYTSIDAFLKDSFARGRESLRREIPQLKKNAASLPNADLDAALSYLRAKSVQVAGVTEQKILDEVKQTLLTGVSKGSDLSTIMDALRLVFEPYVAQTAGVDELLQPSRLETIVRTNLTDVYNQGRLVEGAQAEDFLEGWQYSAIIDGRTTEVCRLMDGVVMLPGDPNVNSLKPPNHFNCRSLMVPIVVGETIDPDSLITPAIAQSADALSGKGF
jgi:SPP1 gp7 family putative phage head morphogenesis protein